MDGNDALPVNYTAAVVHITLDDGKRLAHKRAAG
jgi:hypothetical protein